MMQRTRNPFAVAGFPLICASSEGSAQTAPYRLVSNWGALPDGRMGEAPDAFHRAEPPIVEIDRDGKMLKTWGDKLFAWPHGIRRSLWQPWITDGIYVGETISGTTPTG